MLLFTGKVGVGKTSVAAATAARAVNRGMRVLVTSTDPAHSLADALGTELGDHGTTVPVPRPATGAPGGAGVCRARDGVPEVRHERVVAQTVDAP